VVDESFAGSSRLDAILQKLQIVIGGIHDVPLFGDFTYYVAAVANSPLNAGGGATSATLTPGIRSHLGYDWYFLAGMPVPVTQQRVADLGMIFWLMKAW